MTRAIDLMPEASRARLGQRSRSRRWIALYAGTAAFFVVAGVGLNVARRAKLPAVGELRAQVNFDAEQRAKAAKIRSQQKNIEALLNRQDLLAFPVQQSEVIAVIGEMTPRTMALTSLSSSPRRDRGLARVRAAEGENPVPEFSKLLIEVEGLAKNDQDVANFVQGLEDHPLFGQIALDYTRRTEVAGVTVREFGVTSEIDLTARYLSASQEESQ